MHLCRVKKADQAEVEVAGEGVAVQQAAEAAAGPEAQRSDALQYCWSCRKRVFVLLLLAKS